MYLTFLELDSFGKIVQPKQLQGRTLCALYHGPCGIKSRDYDAVETCDEDTKVAPLEIKCPGNFVRKEEEPMEFNIVTDGIQIKLCI